MGTERTAYQVGEYRTLPLSFMRGRVIDKIPAFGHGRIQPAYVEPSYDPFPFQYTHECLAQSNASAEYSARAVLSWADHYATLGYFLQFEDDPDGERLKTFHSHTELVSAIVGGRLIINCEPLWEAFEFLVRFKFVQKAYRADAIREVNYEKHKTKLERAENEYTDRHKAGRIIHRAANQLKMESIPWTQMPEVKLKKSTSDSGKVSLFYSYSHMDQILRGEINKHLMTLQRQGLIEQWHDRQIGAGDDWKGIIDEHLEKANLISLLISADFIASDYCYDVEMKRALEKHEAGEAIVVPIFLRPCDWEGCPFGHIQGLPSDAKPVTSWRVRDEAFTDVSKGIRSTIEKIRESSQGS